MSDSVSKKLIIVKELINEDTIEDALQLVKDIEQIENLTPEETLRSLYYKSKIHRGLGQLELALKIAEELHQKSEEYNMPFFSLDALDLKGWIFSDLGKEKEFYEILEQQETLFKSILREDSLEFREREGELLFQISFSTFLKGNLDLCLDYLNKSLTLRKQVDPCHPEIARIFYLMSYTYAIKGELKLALEYAEKAISIIPKGEYYNKDKGHIYRNMGNIYQEKG
ncbi:unnamed protein product, partial [marine sediment metagenome]